MNEQTNKTCPGTVSQKATGGFASPQEGINQEKGSYQIKQIRSSPEKGKRKESPDEGKGSSKEDSCAAGGGRTCFYQCTEKGERLTINKLSLPLEKLETVATTE